VLPPSSARTVTVAAARLARWLDGFTERHGQTQHDLQDSVLMLTGADGARAWVEAPFEPLATDTSTDPVAAVVAHAVRRRQVAVVLVRRGGHAAGLFDGATLLASKVGSSYVQGTTKAGGWSQQRYARRRANQADAAFADAADACVKVLGSARPDALVAGGDRDAVRHVLSDRRLAHLPEPTGPWLTVKDPRLKVLAATPEQFLTVRVRLDP
jgi:hypothetical protein